MDLTCNELSMLVQLRDGEVVYLTRNEAVLIRQSQHLLTYHLILVRDDP